MRQTLKNIEIIVVNDCSPDNSEDIILEYAARDDRVVYIRHEENKRQGGARNTGIRAARGKYIAFVDSDDYVDVSLYEAAVRAFEEHETQVDIISMPYLQFYETRKSISFYQPYEGIYKVDLDTLIEHTYFSPWVKIYRACDIKENHIYFPEYVYWEDIAFWAEYCAILRPRVMNLSDAYGFYRYRHRQESTTNLSRVHYKDIPSLYAALYKSLHARGLMNGEVFFSFYKIAMQSFCEAAKYLHRKYYREFVLNFIAFVQGIHFDEDAADLARPWHRVRAQKTYRAKSAQIRRLLYRLKLKSSVKDLYKLVIKLSYLIKNISLLGRINAKANPSRLGGGQNYPF